MNEKICKYPFKYFGAIFLDDKLLGVDKEILYPKIEDGTITEFEFKHYIFSKQIKYFEMLNEPQKIIEKTLRFVYFFGVRMKENSFILPLLAREAWTFSICEKIFSIVSKLISPNMTTKDFNSKVLGHLLNTMRNQLYEIGKIVHLNVKPSKKRKCEMIRQKLIQFLKNDKYVLPDKYIVSVFLSTNPILLMSCISSNDWTSHYRKISLKTQIFYKYSHCQRTQDQIILQLAFVYFKQKRYEESELLFKSILQNFRSWGEIYIDCLITLAECQKALRHNADYLQSCLSILDPALSHFITSPTIKTLFFSSFLNCCYHLENCTAIRDMKSFMDAIVIDPEDEESALSQGGTVFNISENFSLIGFTHSNSRSKNGLNVSNKPSRVFMISKTDEREVMVKLIIVNKFDSDITLDRAYLVAEYMQKIRGSKFTISFELQTNILCKPGRNLVCLFYNIPNGEEYFEGRYYVKKAGFEIGKLTFSKIFPHKKQILLLMPIEEAGEIDQIDYEPFQYPFTLNIVNDVINM